MIPERCPCDRESEHASNHRVAPRNQANERTIDGTDTRDDHGATQGNMPEEAPPQQRGAERTDERTKATAEHEVENGVGERHLGNVVLRAADLPASVRQVPVRNLTR